MLQKVMKQSEIDQKVKWLDYLFKEAMIVDLHLPGLRPKGIGSSWVAIKKEWSNYGWDKNTKVRYTPTQKQVDRYDKALFLGLMLPEYERALIYGVCLSSRKSSRGPQWTRIGRLLGKDRRTIKNEYYGALRLLVKQIMYEI